MKPSHLLQGQSELESQGISLGFVFGPVCVLALVFCFSLYCGVGAIYSDMFKHDTFLGECLTTVIAAGHTRFVQMISSSVTINADLSERTETTLLAAKRQFFIVMMFLVVRNSRPGYQCWTLGARYLFAWCLMHPSLVGFDVSLRLGPVGAEVAAKGETLIMVQFVVVLFG